jgi:hypothetical protein
MSTSYGALQDNVLQEIRHTLTVGCREIVMQGDGAGDKKEEQQDAMMGQIFHGGGKLYNQPLSIQNGRTVNQSLRQLLCYSQKIRPLPKYKKMNWGTFGCISSTSTESLILDNTQKWFVARISIYPSWYYINDH